MRPASGAEPPRETRAAAGAGLSTLHSIVVRREWLVPLAIALEARPGTDTQEPARTARRIATTRIRGFRATTKIGP
ncbi:MAG: hypothetical protein JO063_02275 [Pseudonocardiales bacterium]|nr:hypothetical protein [Pseudonocardiales bacterium]MBW0008939.1 hypothetical protein [Pseudonocardiales bacterium]